MASQTQGSTQGEKSYHIAVLVIEELEFECLKIFDLSAKAGAQKELIHTKGRERLNVWSLDAQERIVGCFDPGDVAAK